MTSSATTSISPAKGPTSGVGVGADQAWIWRCETPGCCAEMGWLVDGQRLLPPNPDQGGTVDPPPRPKDCRGRGDTPAAQVWARLGLGGHAGGASVGPVGPDGNGLPCEHGDITGLLEAASDTGQLRNPHPPDSPHSPIEPRVLFSPGSVSSSDEDDAGSR